MTRTECQVLIIGGGVVGASVLRDLVLRGLDCRLIDRADLAAGTSGANHGLLHSGGRYAGSDPEAARQCQQESRLLTKLAPQCVDPCGGLFVALAGDDQAYAAAFPDHCRAAGVGVEPISSDRARRLAPALTDRIAAAYQVQDGVIDPIRLVRDLVAQAIDLGGRCRLGAEATGFEITGGRVRAVHIRDRRTGAETSVAAEAIVNASGPWSARIAALAGAVVPLTGSAGTMVVTVARLADRVINRLRSPDDGDIILPFGHGSIVGTTARVIDDPDQVEVAQAEIDRLIRAGAELFPGLTGSAVARAYVGVRPLVGSVDDGAGRTVSRGFALLDHAAEGADGLISLCGGKLTTARLMAQAAADLIVDKLGIDQACRTDTVPVPAHSTEAWVDLGRG